MIQRERRKMRFVFFLRDDTKLVVNGLHLQNVLLANEVRWG